jgi:hypothetical protein
MAYTGISQLALGNYLTIAFIEGVHKNISITYPEWELVERMRVGSVDGREARYLLQTSLGPSAVQYRNPGVRSDFPAGSESSIAEGTLQYKELDATIELEYNLYRRILESKSKYDASALAMEVDAKITSLKRQMCLDFYGDGTGVLGRARTVTVNAAGQAVVTLQGTLADGSEDAAQGFAGCFQFGEYVKNYAATGAAGTAPTVTGGTFDHWVVTSRNPTSAANTVTLTAQSSSNANLVVTAWAPTAGEAFYKIGQPTIPNLTSIADYGTASEVITGLESLISADGRTVNGLVQQGAIAGTVADQGNTVIGINAIEQALNQVKNAVGEGRYKWPAALCNRETRSAFIESRETDRRFISIEDNKRGLNKFVYVHQDDSVELKGSEFCKFNRMYLIPEGKTEGQKVLQFRGTDFKPARAENGDVFMFAPGTSGYHRRLMVSYMSGMGQLLSLHNAACVKISGFKLN